MLCMYYLTLQCTKSAVKTWWWNKSLFIRALSQIILVNMQRCRHPFLAHFPPNDFMCGFLLLLPPFISVFHTHSLRTDQTFPFTWRQRWSSDKQHLSGRHRKLGLGGPRSLARSQRISHFSGSLSAESPPKDTKRTLSLDSKTEPTIGASLR